MNFCQFQFYFLKFHDVLSSELDTDTPPCPKLKREAAWSLPNAPRSSVPTPLPQGQQPQPQGRCVAMALALTATAQLHQPPSRNKL